MDLYALELQELLGRVSAVVLSARRDLISRIQFFLSPAFASHYLGLITSSREDLDAMTSACSNTFLTSIKKHLNKGSRTKKNFVT